MALKKINYNGSSKVIIRLCEMVNQLIDGGGGGSTVTYTQTLSSGTKTGEIEIDGVSTDMYAPTPPTNVSDLTNDAGYLTSSDVSAVAMSGDYSDLSNKPTLGTAAAENVGVANGVAELDANGKVPSSQLPSYVDDVIEGYYDSVTDRFYEESTFTTVIPPESGKSWVDIPSNKSYRWTGSVYTRVDEGVQLGETSSTAYRGDRGKTAYDHSQSDHSTISPAFTEASTRANIATGESIATIFGKIKKFFTDLKTVAFSGSYNDLSDTPTIPEELADLTDDSTHRLVTDTEKSTWNNKSDFSGSYNDLSNKPTLNTKTLTQTINGNPSTIKTHTVYTPDAQSVETVDINDGKLTITQNGTTLGTFTANQSADTIVDITGGGSSYTAGDGINISAQNAISVNTTFSEASTRTNIASGDTFATILGKIKKFFTDLKTVAFTGAYSDLSGLPTLNQGTITMDEYHTGAAARYSGNYYSPDSMVNGFSINDGKLTIQQNGLDVASFYANDNVDVTANIIVPTKTSQLTNDSGFITTDNTRVAKAGDTMTGNLQIGSSAQNTLPTVGLKVHDVRNATITPNFLSRAMTLLFTASGSPYGSGVWYSILHVAGWAGGNSAYNPWEIAGPSTQADQRTAPLYVRSSNGATWGSWRKIYDTSNPPNTNELTNGAGFITSSGSCAYATSAGTATNVTKAIKQGEWWNNGTSHNANTVTGEVVFAYSQSQQQNVKTTGTLVGFSCTNNKYPFQLQASYSADNLYFRRCNGDNNTWGSWKRLAFDDEIPTVVSNANANALINQLTIGSSTPVDADYYVSQYVGGGTTTTTYHRRPMSALHSYILGKADTSASANKLVKRDSAGSAGFTNILGANSSNWLGLLAAATACKNYANTAYAPIYASSYPGTSARRFKENIKALTEEEAEKILDVEVVSFDYKADMGISTEEERHGKRGVIAEQVEPIIPSVVTYREEEDGETRIYGVDYSKFVPYLIKMVQMQQKEIDELKAIIKENTNDAK